MLSLSLLPPAHGELMEARKHERPRPAPSRVQSEASLPELKLKAPADVDAAADAESSPTSAATSGTSSPRTPGSARKLWGKASAVYTATSVWHDVMNIRKTRKFRETVESAAAGGSAVRRRRLTHQLDPAC